jgi:hypothetical protein
VTVAGVVDWSARALFVFLGLTWLLAMVSVIYQMSRLGWG